MIKRAAPVLFGLIVLCGAVLGAPVTVAAVTNDTITLFTAVGTPFAPDIPPLPTSVSLRLTLSRTSMVTVDVLNASGSVVKVIQPKTSVTPGQYGWSWSGLNAAGVLAKDGTYTIRARAVNGLGTAVVKKPVRKGLPAIYPANPRAIVITVDPGHGGKFIGSAYNGVGEKYFNLQEALALRDLLEHAGVHVVMTRTTDTAVNSPEVDVNGDGLINQYDDLQKRNDIANEARSDVDIHVHNNAAGCRCLRGSAVYTNYDRTWTPEAVTLAGDLDAEQIAQLTQFSDGTYYPIDLGLHAGHYYYMRPYAVSCPTAVWHGACQPAFSPRPTLSLSVLMESLFVNNDIEFALLERSDVRIALAAAMYLGIADWLNSRDYGIGYDKVGSEPTSVVKGSSVSYGIRVTNRGNAVSNGWSLRLGAVPAVALYDGSPSPGALVGSVAIPDGLQPGQSVDLTVPGTAPATVGSWLLKTDVRLSDNSSLADQGIVPLQLPLTTTIAP
jgi:N-acetylmuramoyl-L-alanine amidase